MSRRQALVGELAAATYAAVVLGVVLAPALLLLTADRGGTAFTLQALDLLAASAVVGLPYAIVAQRRLRRQSTVTRGRTDVWLAAVQGLVVLSLAASLLLALMLHLSRSVQDVFADQEWSLLVLWAGGQVVAVVLAEVTERAAFHWLVREVRPGSASPADEPSPAGAAPARPADSRASPGDRTRPVEASD